MDQLLFFDLDDTLVDHRGAEQAAQRELFEAHGALFDGVSFETWFAGYTAANAALWAAYGRGEIGPAEVKERRFWEPLAAVHRDSSRALELSNFYFGAYARHWRLVDGAEETLSEAARFGVVGLLSNGFSAIQRAKVARFGLDRWASHVVLSEDVGAMKPAREIFDAAVRAAGGGARRKIYVGDSFATDVLGAKNAGWLPIFFNPSGGPVPAPVLFVTRLSDLRPLFE